MGVSAACGDHVPIINDPQPEIVSADAPDGLADAEYTVWVGCEVKNNGDTGDITVSAELGGSGFWKKEQTVAISEGTTEKVEIAFAEADLLEEGLDGFKFTCKAEPA